jgi:predicted nucleic acid-binding protein
MAGVAELLGKIVYLDTNIFVYAVEGYEPEEAFLRELFAALDGRAFAATTSEFTLAELLVKPFELGRDDVVSIYIDLVQNSERITVVPVDPAILIEAARQRPTSSILMPDAIHVAAALTLGCDVFLTSDRRLKLPSGIALSLL